METNVINRRLKILKVLMIIKVIAILCIMASLLLSFNAFIVLGIIIVLLLLFICEMWYYHYLDRWRIEKEQMKEIEAHIETMNTFRHYIEESEERQKTAVDYCKNSTEIISYMLRHLLDYTKR